MQPLSWLIKLYDGVAGPAKSAAGGVEELAESMGGGKKEAGEFDKELKKVRDQITRIKMNPGQFKELSTARDELKKLKGIAKDPVKSDFFAGLGADVLIGGLVTGANAFAGIIQGAMGMATGLATQMLKAGAAQESLGLSFELMLGKDAGSQALKDIDALAGKTKFDDDELAKAVRPLLLGGMKPGKEMFDALAAAVDIETLTGGGLGQVQAVLGKVAKVQAKGGIGTKELEEFGINVQDFYKNLGGSMGESAAAVKKRVAEGKIAPDKILSAVYKAVADKQGGALGTSAERGAATVEGKLMKLENLPGNYFKKIVDSPSWAKLSDLMGGLLDRLDPEGPTGQRIFGALDQFFTSVVGDATKVFDNLKPDDLVKGVEIFVGTLRGAVSVVAEIVSGLRAAVDLISGETLSKSIFTGDRGTQRVTSIDTARRGGASKESIDRLIQDLTASEKADLAALGAKQGHDYGSGIIAGTRSSLDMHSPSRKMMEIGRLTREGFEQGLGDGGLSVDTSLPGGGGISAAGGRSVSIQVDLHIDGAAMKDPAALSAAIDERLTASLLPKILTALDTMGAQAGVEDG